MRIYTAKIKYFRILIFLFFLINIILCLTLDGPQTPIDSHRYVAYANSLLESPENLFQRNFWYVGYAGFLMLTSDLEDNFIVTVIAQILISGLATYFVYQCARLLYQSSSFHIYLTLSAIYRASFLECVCADGITVLQLFGFSSVCNLEIYTDENSNIIFMGSCYTTPGIFYSSFVADHCNGGLRHVPGDPFQTQQNIWKFGWCTFVGCSRSFSSYHDGVICLFH